MVVAEWGGGGKGATNAGYVMLTTNNYTDLIDAVANLGPGLVLVAEQRWAS